MATGTIRKGFVGPHEIVPRRSRHVVTPLLVLALLTAACTGSGGPDAAGDAALDAERAIVGARSDPAATIPKVARLAVNDPDALRSAAMAYIEDTDPQVRSAALHALSFSVVREDGPAVEALRNFLDAEDEGDKLTAAGGLLSIGEKAAMPVLIDLLGSDVPIPYSDPPLEVWEVARGLLLAHTDQNLGLLSAEDAEAAAAVQDEWRGWWGSSETTLTWDPAAWRFTT